MSAKTVAIDLAKNVFELAVADESGRVVERKRFNRAHTSRTESRYTWLWKPAVQGTTGAGGLPSWG